MARWHDDYTINEIETLLTNLCNWVGEHIDNDYNCNDISEREKLINLYVDLGFHKDEVESWY